jgi:hypothetical protein
VDTESFDSVRLVRSKHGLNRIDLAVCLFMSLMCNVCILLCCQDSGG